MNKPNDPTFMCDTCGPFIAVDEDGCCVTCGVDAIIVRRDYADWVKEMTDGA